MYAAVVGAGPFASGTVARSSRWPARSPFHRCHDGSAQNLSAIGVRTVVDGSQVGERHSPAVFRITWCQLGVLPARHGTGIDLDLS